MNQKGPGSFTIEELSRLLQVYRNFTSSKDGKLILSQLYPDSGECRKISELLNKFNEVAEEQIFVSKGKGGFESPPDSPIFDDISLILSVYDKMFPASSTIRIRIGAGMTACVDLLPQILAEFRSDSDNENCSVEVVYGTPEELRGQSDVLDLMFLACDPTATVGQAGVIERIDLLLRLICPAEWPVQTPFDWEYLSGKTLYLLDERRVPSVEVPPAILENQGIQLRRAGSLVVANAMAAAGNAASISPAELVSQSLRGRVQAIEYPNAGKMAFALERPQKRFKVRSADAKQAIDRLTRILKKTLDALQSSPPPRTIERAVLFVGRNPKGGEWQWRRGKTTWTFAWDQRFSGVFEWQPYSAAGMPFFPNNLRSYRVSGYFEKHQDQPIHFSWTAHRTRSSFQPGEQFNASHFVDSQQSLESECLVGTWQGRELISDPDQPEAKGTSPRAFASIGYLILVKPDTVNGLIANQVNELAQAYSKRNGLPVLELPKVIAEP